MSVRQGQSTSRPVRYRLYVDESGDHAYSKLDHIAHRYLALLGVWFQQPEAYTRFADALTAFKRQFFGPRPDHPVVLHRTELVNRKGPFGILSDDDVWRRFDEALLKVVGEADFKTVCVVIDKKTHLDRYASQFHPYHYCLAAMLDRYSGYLNLLNAVGDVMAESRGREEDLQLKQAYRRVYMSGTLMFDRQRHQRVLTSRDLKLERKSANIAGLQLADILAHPVKQHCLIHRGLIPDSGGTFGKQLVSAVMPKFNRQVYQNRIDGYGRVYL